MITIHHLDHSRSHRILWLLEELGLPYDVVRYERDVSTFLAPPELLKVHPLGKAPVIVDGNHVIAESGAIIEYLLETYGDGRLVPSAAEDRLRYRYWLHYAEGSAMPILVLKLIFLRFSEQVPALIRPVARMMSKGVQKTFIDPQLRRHMDYWERELSTTGWFAGACFSAADIQMSFPVETSQILTAGHLTNSAITYPALNSFVDRIRARPSYIRALQAGS